MKSRLAAISWGCKEPKTHPRVGTKKPVRSVAILDKWFKRHPEERALRDKLTVSGLSSALKAVKRAELARKLAGVVDVHVETELRIGGIERMNQKARD